MVTARTGMSQPMPIQPLPPEEPYCSARLGCRPWRPGGNSIGYDRRASPVLFALGGSIRFTCAPGSAALMSFMLVGLKDTALGWSGTVTTALIMSVKWSVVEL